MSTMLLKTEGDLQSLIDNGIEECLTLEYKRAAALDKSSGKKQEISKDVSAMANSAGGQIIYGIAEFDDADLRYRPERLDPVARVSFSKEWLEQVINTNIRPRMSGIEITPIPLASGADDVAYVVSIQASHTAHQAADYRYYKRFNFESVPMEDFEIRDVLNRSTSPSLRVSPCSNPTRTEDDKWRIPITIKNESVVAGRDVRVLAKLHKHRSVVSATSQKLRNESAVNPGFHAFSVDFDVIYKGLSIMVGEIDLDIHDEGTASFALDVLMFCDRMEPQAARLLYTWAGGQCSFMVLQLL